MDKYPFVYRVTYSWVVKFLIACIEGLLRLDLNAEITKLLQSWLLKYWTLRVKIHPQRASRKREEREYFKQRHKELKSKIDAKGKSQHTAKYIKQVRKRQKKLLAENGSLPKSPNGRVPNEEPLYENSLPKVTNTFITLKINNS